MTLIDLKTQVAGGESEAVEFKETTGLRGISLILDSCSKARLNPPKIYEDHGFIYTVFTRPTAQEWKEKVGGGNPEGNESNNPVEDGKAIQTTDTNADKSDEVIQSAAELVQTDGKLAQKRRATRMQQKGRKPCT